VFRVRTFKTYAVFLGILALLAAGCSDPPAVEDYCEKQADCPTGQRCIKNKCTTPVIQLEAPYADPGSKQKVRQNTKVELDGSKSSDPEGGNLTFAWSFVSKPDASKADFDDATAEKPTFFADAEGKFVVQLIVKSDKSEKESEPQEVIITVTGKDLNSAPITNAGADLVTGVNKTIKIDGSSSTDPDGDPITYKWTLASKPSGSQAELTDAETATPSLTPDVAGKYIVELVVSDGLEDGNVDSVTITALTDFDLVPQLDSMTPTEAFSEAAPKVVLKGSGFSANALVLFRGRSIQSKDVNIKDDKEIEITLNLQGISAGVHKMKVRNPNGKESAELDFTVKDIPIPKIDSLSPPAAGIGVKLTLKVTGTGFVPTSEVLFQGTALQTTFVKDTEITAELDLSQTPDGTYTVAVRNPGNRTSPTVDFKVLPPGLPPVLNVLNPPYSILGKQLAFSVHGTGFAPGAVIIFDGKPLNSNRVRRDEIQAVPHLDLTGVKEGEYDVWVRNPDGTTSGKEKFRVEGVDPTPQIDRILPFQVYLDDSTNVISVYGKNFRADPVFYIGTNKIPTSAIRVRSSTYIEVKVDTTKGTWTSGKFSSYVESKSGKKSNKFDLTVTYRIPSLSYMSPGGWTNGCDTDVDVYGSNFVPKAKLNFGSTEYSAASTTHKLTYIDDTHMRFKLKATSLSATTHQVNVVNGPNAKSGNVSFVIRASTSIPKPQIREVRPASAQADTSLVFTLNYNSPGYFLQGAYIVFNGKKLGTTCSSSTSTYCSGMTAKLDLAGIKPGKYELYVHNPCGTKSDPWPFIVTDPPKPHISKVSPAYANPGDKKLIGIAGVNFTKGAKILWDGKAIATTYSSDKELFTANTIDFTNDKAGDKHTIQVDNGNGQKTAVVTFSVLDKQHAPIIDNLSLTAFDRGKSYNGVNVTGSGFTANTKVHFNGKAITTIFNSSISLTISGLDFTNLPAGTYFVVAKDGTKESNAFPIYGKALPPPRIDYLRNYDLFANRDGARMYIYGGNFCKPGTSTYRCGTNPKVVILDKNKKDYGSSYKISSTYLGSSYAYVYGTLDATKMPAGDYTVYLELPTGERSNPAPFALTEAPGPEITSLSPRFIRATSTSTRVSVYGKYFAKTSTGSSTAFVGLKTFPTQYSSTTRVYITISKGALAEGTHNLVIRNPDGKMSKPFPMAIVGTDPIITRIAWYTPSQPYAGRVFSYLRVYGTNWTKGMQWLVDGKPYTATPTRTPYCYVTTSTTSESYCSLYNFSTVGLKPGQHTLQYKYGTKVSKLFTFTLTKGPAPVLTSFSPAYAGKGTKTRITATGKELTNGATLMSGLQVIPTTYSSTSRVYFDIDTTNMTTGIHKLTLRNPDGQLSNTLDFTVLPKLAPIIFYASPDMVNATGKGSLYIYGKNFDANSKVSINGTTVTASFRSGTTPSFYITSSAYTESATGYKVIITNSDGTKSNEYDISVKGIGKPFIRYTSPRYLYPGSSRTVYVYGYGFGKNSVVQVDGQAQLTTVSSTGSYVRFTYTPAATTTVKDLKIKVLSGIIASDEFTLSVIPSSSYTPRITSVSPSSATAGSSSYSTIYVYGSGFSNSSATKTKIYQDGKAVALTTYSSTTRVYSRMTLDFKQSKPGHMYWYVTNGTKRSNVMPTRIESRLMQGQRPRITNMDPYFAQPNKSVTLTLSMSNMSSSTVANYDVIVKGPGLPAAGKTFSLVYSAGYKTTINTTGWQKGVYTIYVKHKTNTGEISGGAGLVVIP